MIDKALVGDRRYWMWILFLVVLGGIALATYLWQWFSGSESSGLSRDVVWGFYIANYTFLVGVAASAVVVVLPYYLHNQKEFGRITALGEFLAVTAVAMSLLFIIVDIGQPFRAFNLLLYPTPNSPFFWNTIILPVYLLLNVIIAWFTLDAERNFLAPPAWVKPLILLSIPWAISIHTFTSFVYSGLVARPFWNTAIMAPRFLASAFASGPALLIILALVVARLSRWDPGRMGIQKVATVVMYAMIANIFFILVEIFTAFYSGVPAHMEHFRYLYLGLEGHYELVPWMWLSGILGVLAVILLINPSTRQNDKTLAAACAAIFVATWIDKGFCMVIAGFIPSPLGKLTVYSPAISELLISIGVYATGLLILTVLYKIATAVKEELATEEAAS